jgi:hypothetical protein
LWWRTSDEHHQWRQTVTNTKTVEIPTTDNERLQLVLSVWNELMANETIYDGTIIDMMDTLVMRTEDAMENKR